MKYLIGCYNKSVIVTYLGICFSVVGMLNVHHLPLAIVCLMIAGICDMFDGKVARMCDRTEEEKEFGIQIDSLADVVSFLVFPIMILYSICDNSPFTNKYLMIAVSCISFVYVLAGVTRLAWFNITTDGHTTHYKGLPVTSIAIILPLVYLIFRNCPFFVWIALNTFVIVAFLFVYNFKVKKLKGVWYTIFTIGAVIGSVLVIWKW